jgi:hypothetical protein
MNIETDLSGLDDPLWPFVLKERLISYIPYARRWWHELDNISPFETGIFAIEYDDTQPPGLYYRFTRTAIRSPIRGIQAFPFVVAGYLQLSGIRGGSTKLIQRLLVNNDFTIDEFTCIELHNLPSTFNQGQLIAFVPTDTFNDVQSLGKWIYLTNEEISALIQRKVVDTVYNKAILKG